MKYLIAYYIIGVLVSLYFIWYYRFSKRTMTSMGRQRDSIGGLIGPWVWPLQILLHIYIYCHKHQVFVKNHDPKTVWVELEYIGEPYDIDGVFFFEKGMKSSLPKEIWDEMGDKSNWKVIKIKT